MLELSAQDLRNLLEVVLDPDLPELERHNAAWMLREHLNDVLEGSREEATPNG